MLEYLGRPCPVLHTLRPHPMMQHVLLIFLSVLFVSFVSLAGVVLLLLHDRALKKIFLYFVSFSTGALLGNVFLHFLPEIAEHARRFPDAMIVVLLGILGSFIVEKFIHWRHCHDLDCRADIHPAGTLVLIGDASHNVLDGILIATSYLVSIPLGISTTIAVLLHEIPQEIGDFVVLLHSGFSKGRALFFNLLSALTALIGAVFVLLLNTHVGNIEQVLLPLAAGNFLYIAGVDLIPELHKETHPRKAFIQLLSMIAGIALMYVLAMGEVH